MPCWLQALNGEPHAENTDDDAEANEEVDDASEEVDDTSDINDDDDDDDEEEEEDTQSGVVNQCKKFADSVSRGLCSATARDGCVTASPM